MLAKARELVEERMAINIASEILGASDSLQNLIARIDAAENPPNPTDAIND